MSEKNENVEQLNGVGLNPFFQEMSMILKMKITDRDHLWNLSQHFAEYRSAEGHAERISEQGEDVSDHELRDGDRADLGTPVVAAALLGRIRGISSS